MKPVLQLPYVAPLPHVDFAFVLIVGFICGLLGALHNKGMFFAQGLYKKISNFAPFSRLIIPFILAGIMAFTWPDLLCGGYQGKQCSNKRSHDNHWKESSARRSSSKTCCGKEVFTQQKRL